MAEAPSNPVSVTLADVLITDRLFTRRPRPRSEHAEKEALSSLAAQFRGSPKDLLNALLNVALDLCGAGTSGLSLLITSPITGAQMFRWHAMAGALAHCVGATSPRNTACGIAIDRKAAQLFRYPGRYFANLKDLDPAIVEGLVLPLYLEDLPLGALWILSHDQEHKFDSEDVRIMSSLAAFTIAALRFFSDDTEAMTDAIAV